jgi:hypothetical protein
VIDKVTGTVLYQVPAFTEAGTNEYGPTQVISDSWLLVSFRSPRQQIEIRTEPLAAGVLSKARAAVRAAPPKPASPAGPTTPTGQWAPPAPAAGGYNPN